MLQKHGVFATWPPKEHAKTAHCHANTLKTPGKTTYLARERLQNIFLELNSGFEAKEICNEQR
jgi:hypothetical protein